MSRVTNDENIFSPRWRQRANRRVTREKFLRAFSARQSTIARENYFHGWLLFFSPRDPPSPADLYREAHPLKLGLHEQVKKKIKNKKNKKTPEPEIHTRAYWEQVVAHYRQNNCFFGTKRMIDCLIRPVKAGRPIAAYRILSGRVYNGTEKKSIVYHVELTVSNGQPDLNYRVNNDRSVRSRLAGAETDRRIVIRSYPSLINWHRSVWFFFFFVRELTLRVVQ